MSDWHVMPIMDLIEHEESDSCICGPKVEEFPPNRLITHNSLDGREFEEWDYTGPNMPTEKGKDG